MREGGENSPGLDLRRDRGLDPPAVAVVDLRRNRGLDPPAVAVVVRVVGSNGIGLLGSQVVMG